jgi:membrane fusion protein
MLNTAVRVSSADAAAATPADDHAQLFRPEVIEEQRTQWLGPVLLRPRISSSVFVSVAIVAATALIVFLLFGTFTRKAALSGWLVPKQGVARVVSSQPGVVTKLHAYEGMKVTRGAPLVAISGEVKTESAGSSKEEVVRRLTMRRNSLAAAIEARSHLLEKHAIVLSQQLETLNRQKRSFVADVENIRVQVRMNDGILTRERMRGTNFNDPARWGSKQHSQFELETKLQGMERNRLTLDHEIAALHAQIQAHPLKRQLELEEMARNLAALEQELTEAEARREFILEAPHDGVVTAIQTEIGGSVAPSTPLLTLVPADSILLAHLFGTSRAVGFLRPGQKVLLRYHAYPYQKFGLYEGVVSSISQSAISPSEVTQQLSGLTSLYGSTEPIYRVTVELSQQTAMAYGQAIPLQAGMQLEADVLLESRRLVEWIFDPLFAITGRVSP